MKATFETAGFVAGSVWAVDKIQDYNGIPKALRVPPLLVATVAAIAQRTVSYLANNITKDLKNEKKDQTFIKSFDYTVAGLTAAALAKPLTQAIAEELRQAQDTSEEPPEPTPIHPGYVLAAGIGTSQTAASIFDYLSPAKFFAGISEFPHKNLPLGGYLISFATTLQTANQIMQTVQPLIKDEATRQLSSALVCAAAAGTLTSIIVADLLAPNEKSSKQRI
jgi:hypothetical protein